MQLVRDFQFDGENERERAFAWNIPLRPPVSSLPPASFAGQEQADQKWAREEEKKKGRMKKEQMMETREFVYSCLYACCRGESKG